MNYPGKVRFSYVGIRQHADGRYSNHIRHRNVVFRPLFRLVRHRNMVWWKYRIVCTIVVLIPRWPRKDVSSRTYHQYDGTILHDGRHSSRLIVVGWVPGYSRPCTHSTAGPRPRNYGLRHRPMYRATVMII